MKHCNHFVSTAEALRLVFLPPLRAVARPPRLPHASQLQRRYATAPPNGAFNMAGRFVRADKTSSSSDQRPRNERIRAPRIHIVQPDGKLGPPQSLSFLLRSIDPKEEFIEQVDHADDVPVCKIINKKEAREAAKAAKARKKAQPSQVTKYLELNWAIDKNDLEHRLGKLGQFLEQGRRVEVVLMKKKKRMRDASEEEGRGTLEALDSYVRGVEGAREVRPMEGDFLGRATLFYEGKFKGAKEAKGREGRADKAVGEEEHGHEPGKVEEEPAKAAGHG